MSLIHSTKYSTIQDDDQVHIYDGADSVTIIFNL